MARRKANAVSTEGDIGKNDTGVYLRLRGKDKSATAGTVCLNPEADVAERIYERRFQNPRKRIFLPGEEDMATAFLKNGIDVVTIGMTGYSTLKPEQLAQWGIQDGAYEEACAAILAQTIHTLTRRFPGVRIKVTHGASDMGIDRVVIRVAKELNLDQLGFNCPAWMWYVTDDEVPVFVAKDKDAYADSFVRHTDILLSVGGREQSLVHDITAAIRHGKCLIPCPIMQAISNNGGPPPRDGDGKIQDATRALMTSLRLPTVAGFNGPIHTFDDLANFVTANAAEFAQSNLLSPSRAYSWEPVS